MVYVLGAGLLLLAYWMLQGVDEDVDPEKNPLVRLVRRVLPITTDARDGRFFVREEGRLMGTT